MLCGRSSKETIRAVEGEMFMVPCVNVTGVCRERSKSSPITCGNMFPAKANHSGNYTCDTGGSNMFLFLQVVERSSLGCVDPKESSKILLNAQGGNITCPGRSCMNNSDVIWYKGDRAVSKQRRALCEEDGRLHLCQVREVDTGVYFCDRQIIEQGVIWTFRRAVSVKVIPHYAASYPPKIVDPDANATKEVELGQTYTLTCEVHFPVEIYVPAVVRWFMNYGGNMKNMTPLHMEKPQHNTKIFEECIVIQTAIIEEVTPQHLNHTYTCIASNSVGNSSATISLKKKNKVKWPSLVGYPFVCLLLVTGVVVILHVKWLEIQLFYRSHFQHGKHDEDEKEFDVFLSYVWSPSSAEVEGGATLSFLSGPDNDEEARLSWINPLNIEEGGSIQTPLEVLLPQVLEVQWGYRLCLLERDVLPGGAYTNDVVNAIQRSRMLICLLSADYLCDSNAVFVLESGVQALLQNSALKLLLIWTSKPAKSLIPLEPPLPTMVQRALMVLPSLDWTSGKFSRGAICSFWRSLKKAMPKHREQSWFHA
ncbi:interleukin-18 receptor accessory protein-like isoform X2 [Anabas testudineus]|uniref:interleukin-18 receptor accessory protein-like isoform X2 n=1 Tax=Anabas testudineus TaxID=64144 RepID=UPI000E461BC1|nr:interleukin-18 receptor accessory protein-like isoform X2 [Anabas testudineus]